MSEKLLPEKLLSSTLTRKLRLWEMIWLGLGSMVGAGIFVSVGIAAEITNSAIVLAIALAALLAICNGLNSAQLAINFAAEQGVNYAVSPTGGVGTGSKGTYVYGYRYLSPWLRFVAGWTLLLAMLAVAATAALGCAGYLLYTMGQTEPIWLVPTALATVLLVSTIALLKSKSSSRLASGSFLAVAAAVASLLLFIAIGVFHSTFANSSSIWGFITSDIGAAPSVAAFLHATSIMFVAYVGYERITSLGEAVSEPRRMLPQVLTVTVILTMLLYLGVAIVGIGTVGATVLGSAVEAHVAPLEVAMRELAVPGSAQILAVGAIAAMLGVMFNLILDSSQLVVAMGQQQDIPRSLIRLNPSGAAPMAGVVVSVAMAGIILLGDVKTTWSVSAFAVLVYCAVTNLAALKLSSQQRLYPRWLTWVGLLASLFLAFWVNWEIWLVSLGLIAVGLIWRGISQWANEQSSS